VFATREQIASRNCTVAISREGGISGDPCRLARQVKKFCG
jgi:hypothetical protein